MNLVSVETALLLVLVVLLFQTAAMAVALGRLKSRLSALDQATEALSERTGQVVAKLGTVIDHAVPLSEKVPQWAEGLNRMADKIVDRARRGNEAAEETLANFQGTIQETEERLNQALQAFSRYSYQVHRAIVDPSQRISGALTRFAGLFRRVFFRGRSPEFVTHDEDFI